MIRLILDSASDCAAYPELFHEIVPLTVHIGGKDYCDGVDLTADRFYELLTAGGEFPKTSQPSPERFFKAFRKAKLAGDAVLCITISSALSGTYQSAVIAREMVDYEDIHIVDACMVSHLIGYLAAYARRRIADGADAATIAQECEALKGRIRVFAGLDTLEYLQKGGRLGKASAAVGQLAGIKPIVTFTPEGAVAVGAKVIGVPRAVSTIVSKVQSARLDEAFPIFTLYTSGTENLELLERKLRDAGFESAGRRQVGPTIGAHVGPNVYGVVYVVKE